jgi:hypothetical protein
VKWILERGWYTRDQIEVTDDRYQCMSFVSTGSQTDKITQSKTVLSIQLFLKDIKVEMCGFS